MKRLMFIGLTALILGTVTTPLHSFTVSAKPPSGDANPSDLGNRTVDTSQIIAAKPPSGDANPSDLGNRTVDTSQIIV